MPVTFTSLKEQQAMPLYTFTERTYLDAEGNPTTDESKARELLGTEGEEIPQERAAELGLVKSKPKAEAAPEPAPEPTPEPDPAPAPAKRGRPRKS